MEQLSGRQNGGPRGIIELTEVLKDLQSMGSDVRLEHLLIF